MSRALLTQLHDLSTRWPAVAKILRATPACLGLDVGSHAVKGVVLQKTGTTLTLLRSAVIPVAAGGLSGSAARAQAVRQALEAVQGRTVPVVAAVGGPGTVLRSVLLPKMTPQELTTALAFEAEKHIPFKLDEALVDSAIVGDRSEGRMEILLAAARRELVEAVLAMLTSAGVAPAVLDLEAAALANAWELSPQGAAAETVGLLHVGARGTIVAVFAGAQLQFTREIPVGGEAFTQAVAAALSLDAARAEAIKCEPGERAAEVQAALQPSWDEWLGQCRGSFDFFENQFGHGVNRVVLSGGSAGVTGLVTRVQEVTGLPAQVWNPLAGVPRAATASDPGAAAVTLGIAVGLARRGLAG